MCSNQLSYTAENGAHKQTRTADLFVTNEVLYLLSYMGEMVGVQGFEPWKAEPTDLQSVPFDRSGTLPNSLVIMCNFQAAARLERCFRSSEQGNNTLGIHPVSTLYTPPGVSIWHLISHTFSDEFKTPGQ